MIKAVLPMPDNDQSDNSQYKTARALLQFFSVIGWLVVALGIIGALMLVADQGISAIMSAATTVVAGLFLVAITQVTQALLDSADHLREIKSNIKRANGLS